MTLSNVTYIGEITLSKLQARIGTSMLKTGQHGKGLGSVLLFIQ